MSPAIAESPVNPEYLVRESLKVPDEFLTTYADVVQRKFLEAADKFARDKPADAITQCLHLASSVVLRNPDHLEEALAAVKARQRGEWENDPATLLTVAAIHYLLHYVRAKNPTDEQPENEARARLDLVLAKFAAQEWLIGKDAMQGLGIGATK